MCIYLPCGLQVPGGQGFLSPQQCLPATLRSVPLSYLFLPKYSDEFLIGPLLAIPVVAIFSEPRPGLPTLPC